jgi:2Fe-2S ferredoxin
MARITWITADGRRWQAEVNDGDSLMLAATFDNVPGIGGDCGGCLSCATCHVVVDPAWAPLVGGPGDEESQLLDTTASPRQPHSRLSCQILGRPEFDGLVVHVPPESW